jgi:hypothetical protein
MQEDERPNISNTTYITIKRQSREICKNYFHPAMNSKIVLPSVTNSLISICR